MAMTHADGDDNKPVKTESPIRHYDKPQEVVRDRTLNVEEKHEVLDTWQDDAEALQRAEDEGMGGGEPSKLIDVVSARTTLEKVQGTVDANKTGVSDKPAKPRDKE
jgi:hypothetical protein